ncbi:MAG: hypothetical protein JRF02_01585 [Deltaproteobacteria bacterium]|jgi:hypothetical protein|nr:hypothetical protein [Deltaproteobacteria bacterium]
MTPKIIQIIPAADWYAKYEEEGNTFLEPVACWAILDRGGETVIEGLVPVEGTLVQCNNTKGFTEFIHREKIGE